MPSCALRLASGECGLAHQLTQLTSIGPRFKSGPQKGQCNPMAQPGAKGAVVSFLASLVLTVK